MAFSGISGKIPGGQSSSSAIPPAGTSARKAYDKTMRQGTGVPQTVRERLTGTYSYPAKSAVESALDTVLPDDSKPKPKLRRSSGGSSGGSSARATFDYYEAPLAEYYGFGKETAYQEAMANTAYRREIADMRKAGLNPSVIYGEHNTTGAASDVYPRGGSGGSGGSGRRSGRGKSGNYVFSGGAYYGIMAAVGTATTLATHNVGAGMAASAMAGTAMKALNGFLKGR